MHTYDDADLRLSDRERKAAQRDLDRQHAKGRIDKDELAARSDAVGTARTWGDLAPVFADLRPSRGRRPSWRRGWFPLPLVPLLVVAGIVLAATGHVPWVPVLIALGLVLVFGPRRHWSHGSWSHGSWSHGSWSRGRGWAC